MVAFVGALSAQFVVTLFVTINWDLTRCRVSRFGAVSQASCSAANGGRPIPSSNSSSSSSKIPNRGVVLAVGGRV